MVACSTIASGGVVGAAFWLVGGGSAVETAEGAEAG